MFPSLEEAGISKTIGPITMMLIDPDHSKKIGKQMEESAKEYFASGNSTNLINDIKQYT